MPSAGVRVPLYAQCSRQNLRRSGLPLKTPRLACWLGLAEVVSLIASATPAIRPTSVRPCPHGTTSLRISRSSGSRGLRRRPCVCTVRCAMPDVETYRANTSAFPRAFGWQARMSVIRHASGSSGSTTSPTGWRDALEGTSLRLTLPLPTSTTYAYSSEVCADPCCLCHLHTRGSCMTSEVAGSISSQRPCHDPVLATPIRQHHFRG